MTAEPAAIAPAFRSVDQLTGRIAELERQHEADRQQIAEAEQQRDEWCRRCGAAIAERDQARDELATARAVGSWSGS